MEKIKSFISSEAGKDIMVVLIVILTGLGSFGLGRLSKENASTGVKIEYPKELTSLAGNAISATTPVVKAAPTQKVVPASTNTSTTTLAIKNYFASSRGHKYYPAGCSAGKSLSMDNRIYFSTREEAEAAGYTLSNSCD